MTTKGSNIEDLFREGLANHEMPVNSTVWAGVQASIAGGAAATAGSSGLTLSLITASIGVALTAVAVFGELQYQSHQSTVAEEQVIEYPAEPQEVDQIPSAEVISKDEVKQIIAEIEAQPEFKANSTPPHVDETLIVSDDRDQVETYADEAVDTNQVVSGDERSVPIVENPAKRDAQEGAKGQAPESTKTEQAQESNKMDEQDEGGLNEETPPRDVKKFEAMSMVDLGIPEDAEIAIAPGRGGSHDCFELPYMSNVAEFHIQIWTRGGYPLFESNDPMFRWCGTDLKGQTLKGNQTVYFMITAFDYDGVQYEGPKTKSYISVYGN